MAFECYSSIIAPILDTKHKINKLYFAWCDTSCATFSLLRMQSIVVLALFFPFSFEFNGCNVSIFFTLVYFLCCVSFFVSFLSAFRFLFANVSFSLFHIDIVRWFWFVSVVVVVVVRVFFSHSTVFRENQ